MRTALAATALLLLASCSSDGLTAADAVPFQACSQDQDCVLETLSCKGSCQADVAINRDQVLAFEQARGCWPAGQNLDFCGLGSCQAARCAAGQCVVGASPACGPVPQPNTSTGFVTSSAGGSSGAVGFDATISTGTTGGSGSSGSSSGSGSVGGSSGSSGGASASSGSGSGSTGGSGTSGSGSLGSSGGTT